MRLVTVGTFRWIIGIIFSAGTALAALAFSQMGGIEERVGKLSTSNATIVQALHDLTASNNLLVSTVNQKFGAYDMNIRQFYIDYAGGLNWAKRQSEE
tara:strand:- start:360 stop:653 length:294 start_codon:yes stop_codon:yes gene_type:complete